MTVKISQQSSKSQGCFTKTPTDIITVNYDKQLIIDYYDYFLDVCPNNHAVLWRKESNKYPWRSETNASSTVRPASVRILLVLMDASHCNGLSLYVPMICTFIVVPIFPPQHIHIYIYICALSTKKSQQAKTIRMEACGFPKIRPNEASCFGTRFYKDQSSATRRDC